MKAPTPTCLQALRSILFPPTARPPCPQIRQRRNAFSHHSIQRASKPTPLTPKQPPKPTSNTPAQPPPSPQKVTSNEGSEDFIPLPLSRPIGMPTPPHPGENTGIDPRGLQQRRDDFVDYDKHLQKRARMTRQISKPYFRDWSNLRFQKGKVFVAPRQLFKAEFALFFPNFYGRTLEAGAERTGGRRDGYRGLGRNTCAVMEGKVSVVSVFTSTWALNQTRTFVGRVENPGVRSLLKHEGVVFQEVEINYEDNLLKYWILKLFGLRKLRKERSEGERKRYFVVRRGVSDIIKEALGLMNLQVGYVYLVDPQLRIRWAGSANAEEHEKESLVRGARKLIQEAKGMDSKSRLNVAVEELVDDVVEGKKAAAAA